LEYSPAGTSENVFQQRGHIVPREVAQVDLDVGVQFRRHEPRIPDFPSSAGSFIISISPSLSGYSGPDEGIRASFVTVTKTLSKSGEFVGAAVVAGDKVEGANVVPAGKLGADAMETPTVAGPDTPEEVEPVPPPHAARAMESATAKNRCMNFRYVPIDGFIPYSSSLVSFGFRPLPIGK